MIKKMLTKTIYCTFLIATISLFNIAGTSAKENMSDALRKEVEAVIQDYILKNPEVLMRAIQTYQVKAQAAKSERAKKNLTSLTSELSHNAGSPVIGNPAGDITIVEFFDYRCGYCKRVFPTIQALLEEDGNIRYVLKELPILGPDSLFASQAALAVWNTTPEKYLPFHAALMASRGSLNAEKIFTIADDLGLNKDVITKGMKNESVNNELNKNAELSERLDITGTPAFIIGDQLSPGAISMQEIKRMVALARKR
jgi:protein-disulfide isomerase